MTEFPRDFLIGTATAAHQVEGNNLNSDYWAMEHMEFSSFNEPSGDAVDHYHHFEEDIKLLADAGADEKAGIAMSSGKAQRAFECKECGR